MHCIWRLRNSPGGGSVARCYGTTPTRGEGSEKRQRNKPAYVKALKTAKQLGYNLQNSVEGGGAFQTSLSPGKLTAGKELAGRMERFPPFIYYLDQSFVKDVKLQAAGLIQVRLIDYFKVYLTAKNCQN